MEARDFSHERTSRAQYVILMDGFPAYLTWHGQKSVRAWYAQGEFIQNGRKTRRVGVPRVFLLMGLVFLAFLLLPNVLLMPLGHHGSTPALPVFLPVLLPLLFRPGRL